LIWTQRADQVSNQLKTTHKATGFNGKFDLWATGTLSSPASKQLELRGFKLTENAGQRVGILE
jgi:hypothetical protein